jgi:hypothetical protein
MKKFILLLSLIALFCQSSFAQTGGLNFQGVARNSTGAVLANQKINLKFSILKTTETGAVEYTETKEVTTNAQGIFAVVVGEVNASSFAAVDWKASPKFLKVEMDPAGGTSFVSMGTTRLQNVPYAYYANGVNANNIDGTISVAKGGTGATDAAAARTNLGLVIGTNVQAPLTAGTDYLTPSGNAATATKLATAKKINGVDFDGSSDISISATADASTLSGTVSVAKGGTGATTATDARANLGLVIGTNVQAPLTAGTDYLTPTGSAASLTDFPTLNQNTTGNAATATKLATAKKINGVDFDGSSDITIVADASTLSGTVSVAKGGTGLTTAGTAGQVLTSTGSGTFTWTSSGVPYSGATGAVNFGAYDLTVNGITIGKGKNSVLSTNTVFGNDALANPLTSDNNTAIGHNALKENGSNSYGNTALGANTLTRNTAPRNTAVGLSSLQYNVTGESNTAVGQFALKELIAGSNNTGIGSYSLSNNLGNQNTAIGAGSDVTSGNLSNATAIGFDAKVATSNTIQLGNGSVTNVKTNGTITAGDVTYPNTHGTNGQVLSTTGSGTLTWTTSGVPYSGATQAVNLGAYDLTVNGITIGKGKNSVLSTNTVFGNEALANPLTGDNNTAIGHNALKENGSNSGGNTALGANTLTRNTASRNTAIGLSSLQYNVTGESNTAVGQFALKELIAGSNNTGIGSYSLSNNLGNQNTAIGAGSDVTSANLSNATAIGFDAKVATSNTIQLGNTFLTTVKTSGKITTGDVTYPNTHGSNGQVLTTSGSGTLTWSTLAGLPTTGNTGGDMLYWNGTAWVKVAAGSDGQTLTFYNGAPIWLGANTVVSRTGRIWMDRNLGASQVATSSADAASLGDLYQWGRGADGHQLRSSSTTATLSSSDQPGNSNFIITSYNGDADWRNPKNANLWQGVNGVNNPCPTGFRIPTDTEWEAERLTWSVSSSVGAFDSPLKLTMAGNRVYMNGALNAIDLWGEYWSSTASGITSKYIFISRLGAEMDAGVRALGASVRCIKD